MSERPVLRVVRGDAAPEEIAALMVAVTAASARRSAPAAPRPASAWNAPARRVRPPMHPGPGAWRASALPG